MDVGMLWFDDDPKRGLEEKIARAVAHYRDKYGQAPTLCFVNPATLNGSSDVAAGVQVRAARSVLPNHFWVGVGDPAARVALGEKGNKGTKGSKGTKGTRTRSRVPSVVPAVP